MNSRISQRILHQDLSFSRHCFVPDDQLRSITMKTRALQMVLRASWVQVLLLFSSALLIPLPGLAAITLRVEQKGADVHVTGNGSANTTGLTLFDSRTDFTNIFTDIQIYAGSAADNNGLVNLWSGPSGPLTIGSDPSIAAGPSTSGSVGGLFGIVSDEGSGNALLVLPSSYGSGENLNGISRFPGIDLATLGLSTGTYTWSWGSGSNADSLEIQVYAPSAQVPAPLPLVGAAVAWKTSRRLRRIAKPWHTHN